MGVESREWEALGIRCYPISEGGFWDELPAHPGSGTEVVGVGALELQSRDLGGIWGWAKGKDLVEVAPGIPRQPCRRIPSPSMGIWDPWTSHWEWALMEQDTAWGPPAFWDIQGIPERLLPLENRAGMG